MKPHCVISIGVAVACVGAVEVSVEQNQDAQLARRLTALPARLFYPAPQRFELASWLLLDARGPSV